MHNQAALSTPEEDVNDLMQQVAGAIPAAPLMCRLMCSPLAHPSARAKNRSICSERQRTVPGQPLALHSRADSGSRSTDILCRSSCASDLLCLFPPCRRAWAGGQPGAAGRRPRAHPAGAGAGGGRLLAAGGGAAAGVRVLNASAESPQQPAQKLSGACCELKEQGHPPAQQAWHMVSRHAAARVVQLQHENACRTAQLASVAAA
jgi:hypothetical protein